MADPRDFEKLGLFYLGREVPAGGAPGPGRLVLYDARHLLTHAVCVGMTGSGKTGLCLALLEEAALDGVPAIAIDPKGDLPNLLLTFPDLAPADFAPWVNEDDARRAGLSREDFARQQAETWRTGLAGWGQDGARIRRLRETVEMVVYTPGSTAGVPLSLLGSFAAPAPALRQDRELLAERVTATATSLLGLLGLEADPVKSREHTLLATVLDHAWRQGRDLDLAGLVQAVQQPPVARIGLLDVDAFLPSKDRFALALAINNLLAAPGFETWTTGEPLDAGRLLHSPAGKPRIAIVSIAHLGDAERMFVVSLLLGQVLAWMRGQSGTTSLRAILYMDEVMGYFPPVAAPPSKAPLLTLLKQARAFGLGVVLATQNPVDLDYKGLSNAGTWLIGRLQTERDRARLLDGLEGAAAGGLDRSALAARLAGLGQRRFLLHDVHENEPVVFETRWAMSYLRGPLARGQIKTLMDPYKAALGPPAATPARVAAPAAAAAAAPPVAAAPPPAAARPVLPPEVPQHALPRRRPPPAGAVLVYEPWLLGLARVRFVDRTAGVDAARDVAWLAPLRPGPVPLSWEEGRAAALGAADLETGFAEGASFGTPPPAAAQPKSYERWRRDLVAFLLARERLALWRSPSTGLVSRPEESERDFRIRLQEQARGGRDAAVDRIRKKYGARTAALQEKIRRAEQALARESEQVGQQIGQTVISGVATVLGAMLGRGALSTSNVGRATTAARGAARVLKERKDVDRARETLEAYRQQLAALEREAAAEAAALGGPDLVAEALEAVAVAPTRPNVGVRLVSLAWAPAWRTPEGGIVAAWE
jgi:hypothetical protein